MEGASLLRRATAMSIVAAALVCAAGARAAERLSYVSVGACMAAARVPLTWCENAAANARAAFEESAPVYARLRACERAHGAGRCAPFVGQGGAAFAPRQAGFVIMVRSMREASVTPGARGVEAKPRSVLTRDVSVASRGGAFGMQDEGAVDAPPSLPGGKAVDAPAPWVGKLPPRPKFDPNFDCSSVLEPNTKGDGSPGCYPAPARRP